MVVCLIQDFDSNFFIQPSCRYSLDMIVNKDGKSVTVVATTANDQSQPSPTRVRLRKSRRRHNPGRSSTTSGHSTSSPVKSPSKETLNEEFENKSNSSKNDQQKNDHLSPSAFKYMGPGTAIRESGIEFSHSESEQPEQKNLNDVCFGCDGSCSDITCSSKRSSRISADVESNICDSECTSPTHQVLRRILDVENMNPEEREETEIDSNQNLEQKSTSLPEKSGTGNGNNTDEDVIADDVIPVDTGIPEISVDAVTINNYSNLKNGSLKRSISDNPVNQSPSKIPHMRMDSTDSEGQYMICRSIGIQARARQDSWSEDEGAVGDSEEDFT